MRNDGEPEHSPAVIAAYQIFAAQVIADIQQEAPKATGYTLDMAIINGAPAVIELNALKNYGLYAMDFRAILEAQWRALEASRTLTGKVDEMTM